MKKDILFSALVLIFVFNLLNGKVNNPPRAFDDKFITAGVPAGRQYNLVLDSFFVETGQIKPDLFMANLFSNYNISYQDIELILKKAKGIFDVRKLRRGNPYMVFTTKDSVKTVQYIVYEQNPVDYVVFDFRDTMNVYTAQKPVIVKTQTASGIIHSNLWQTMQENELDPLMANDLSEIYAWTVDFFGLQDNDKFKIIYEQQFVGDKIIGVGKIKAAYFEHYGKTIYAIPFYQDSTISFYDIDGTSLRRSFLKAPLKYSRIASGFSNSRLHPILKIYRPHHGVDYSAPIGTPVYSIGDGIVVEATYANQAGKMVKIKHNGVYTTGYLHLLNFADGLHAGTRVRQGEVIGYVGSTGLSTGPHLDFRVWKNGEAINPLNIDAPPVEPVKQENKAAFEKIMQQYKKQLDEITYKILAR